MLSKTERKCDHRPQTEKRRKMKPSPEKLEVQGTLVRIIGHNGSDYVCITDIAALKNPLEPKDVVKNWMRSRSTLSFLGHWEKLHNPAFKGVDFDPLLAQTDDNALKTGKHRS